MVLSIKVRLRTEIFDTVMVFRFGPMEPSTRVTGKKVLLQAEANSTTLTVTSMMVRNFLNYIL